jgi:hypothetical protein
MPELKSIRNISCVNVELRTSVSEIYSVSIIRVVVDLDDGDIIRVDVDLDDGDI